MSLDTARRVLEIEADSVRRQIDNLGPGFVAAIAAIGFVAAGVSTCDDTTIRTFSVSP